MRFEEPKIDLYGYDPYDGLNSYLFNLIKYSKLLKISLIQFNKRSPINFRKILGIKKEINPKALALMILSYYERNKRNLPNLNNKLIEEIIKNTIVLQDKEYKGWGYPFPWQSKSFFFRRGLSNTVVSSFVGLGLIEYYKETKDKKIKNLIEDLIDFFINKLNKHKDKNGICLSYSPIDNTKIINTSLLAGEFLIKYYSEINTDSGLEKPISSIFNFAILNQNNDGSWYYGIEKKYNWIDSFHTGYVLVSLNEYYKLTNDIKSKRSIQKGFNYYKNNFLLKNGIVKYYNNKIYPIDIHSIAQAIITLKKLENFKENNEEEFLKSIIHWTNANMYNKKKRYFYFQKKKSHKNKINYLRWSQAWIYYANSFLSENFN